MKGNQRSRASAILALALALGFGVSCSTASRPGTKLVASGNAPITELELQDRLLRFSGEFSERNRDAMRELLASPDPEVRRRALHGKLLYDASALDIALGPRPEANLLDMVAFVELSRDALRQYWVPKVYGEAGEPLLRAFDRSTSEIWRIARGVLDPKQTERLSRVMQDWRAEHQDQVAVEAVRLSQFSVVTRSQAVRSEVSGLMASVAHAAVATDEARLLGERFLFYAQRAPFLLRLQAVLGAEEAFGEVEKAFTRMAWPIREDEKTLRVLGGFQTLMQNSSLTLDSARDLLRDAAREPRVLEVGAKMIGELASLAREVRASQQVNGQYPGMAGVADRLDVQIQRAKRGFFELGAGLIGLAFVASLTSRLLAQYLGRRWR